MQLTSYTEMKLADQNICQFYVLGEHWWFFSEILGITNLYVKEVDSEVNHREKYYHLESMLLNFYL